MSAPCRYRLDTDSSATLNIPGGRKIGYAQYGNLTGHAIFTLHGLPGSRLECARYDTYAKKLDIRIIAVDRPGIGWSTPHPTGTILDHARDVARLADHLNLDSYGVMGSSAGGPFGLACALLLPPNRLKVVAIVCGLGPPDMGYVGMNWHNWAGFKYGYRYFAWAVRWWFASDPTARLDLSDEERFDGLQKQWEKVKLSCHSKDVAIMSDQDQICLTLRTAREVYAQGFDGLLRDGRLIASDFGFCIEDIRDDLPVHLWYGRHDTMVPANHGEKIAARIGPNAHLRIEDETHFSLVVNKEEEVLREMVTILKG